MHKSLTVNGEIKIDNLTGEPLSNVSLHLTTEEEITLDSDDEFVYEEVPVEDDSVPPGKQLSGLMFTH